MWGCCGNPGRCLFAMCFPNCAAASARSAYDGSNYLFNCCCVPPCAIYNFIREGYGIEGSCMGDILWNCCCPVCTIVQMWEETRLRGPITRATNIKSNWSVGLFGCQRPMFCLYAMCFPQCAAASVRTQYDSSDWIFNCCIVGPFAIQNLIREGYYINGTIVEDICIMWCCGPCAIHRVQEAFRQKSSGVRAASSKKRAASRRGRRRH